jgi:hypothetical protein
VYLWCTLLLGKNDSVSGSTALQIGSNCSWRARTHGELLLRPQILRLLVTEVLVGSKHDYLRHSIPIPQSGSASNASAGQASAVTGSRSNPGYLLRSRSQFTLTGEPLSALCRRSPEAENRWQTRDLRFLGFTHICGKNWKASWFRVTRQSRSCASGGMSGLPSLESGCGRWCR